MRRLLSSYGSRGDAEPLWALAVRWLGLRAEVWVCTSPNVAPLLPGVGVPLAPAGACR